MAGNIIGDRVKSFGSGILNAAKWVWNTALGLPADIASALGNVYTKWVQNVAWPLLKDVATSPFPYREKWLQPFMTKVVDALSLNWAEKYRENLFKTLSFETAWKPSSPAKK